MARRTQQKVLAAIKAEKLKQQVDLVMTPTGYAAIEKPAVKKPAARKPVVKKTKAKKKRGARA